MFKSKLKVQNIICILLMIAFAFLSLSCKQQSTFPQSPDEFFDNYISLSCNPVSGGTGAEVTILILITKNQNEITAFGFEMTFDPAIFQLQKIEKGTLTGSWAALDGNENTPGNLIVGGYMGSGTAVASGSSGSLVQIKLKVIYSGSDNNFSRQFTIKNYVDNIAGMKPDPASATFTFRK
jgi:hypothetical protein